MCWIVYIHMYHYISYSNYHSITKIKQSGCNTHQYVGKYTKAYTKAVPFVVRPKIYPTRFYLIFFDYCTKLKYG